MTAPEPARAPVSAPETRAPRVTDVLRCLSEGTGDFLAAPLPSLFFATFFVVTGLLMAWVTYATGQTFWLVLAVMGFPLVGSLAALGFYEISRRRMAGEPVEFSAIAGMVWAQKNGQLPWLAAIIIVIFMFWFFLGHMIFALFLGLSPMTNVSSSLDVFLKPDGLMMLGFGSVVGAVFATVIFSISVLGIPMLLDRDVDFMTAMFRSMAAVRRNPVVYIGWGALIGFITLISMAPFFLGLFLTMPILGHATWRLYQTVTD